MKGLKKRCFGKAAAILIVLAMLFTILPVAYGAPGGQPKAAPAIANELLKDVTGLENPRGWYISQVARELPKDASEADIIEFLEDLDVEFPWTTSSMSVTASLLSSGERVNVLIGFDGKANIPEQRANNKKTVEDLGGEIYAEFTIVNAVAASIPVQAIKGLEKRPGVSYVELDAEAYALGQAVPWGIDRVFGEENHSFPTWTASFKGEGIGVAVLDTGIAIHEDLRIAGGTNTISDTDNYHDGHGHGTHVAGTVAALDNGIGVVGVAPKVDLYAVKVLSDTGSGSYSSIISGIEWAVGKKIPIINMSLGGSSDSLALEAACDAAYAAGVLLVSSAGNSGNPAGRGDNVGYPAAYQSVIAVAASNSSDKRASFSSTGSTVELIAPGVNILSTIPNDGYQDGWNGTSMASPHVAGAAALVWGADSDLTNDQVREILQRTAQNLGLSATQQGYGLVRADLAVAEVPETESATEYTLKVAVDGNGSTDPESGDHDYAKNTVVELTATAEENWAFDRWEVNETVVPATNGIISVTMDADKTAIAYFNAITTDPENYSLYVNKEGDGTVEVDNIIQDLPFSSEYTAGTEVRLKAMADSGWEFVKWVIDNQDILTSETTVTMDTNINATAYFSEEQVSTDPITELNVAITSPEPDSEYTWNSWVDITVVVTDQDRAAVAGANVTVTVDDSDLTVATDANGNYTARYRVANRSEIKDYTITASATYGNIGPVDAEEINFKVTGR